MIKSFFSVFVIGSMLLLGGVGCSSNAPTVDDSNTSATDNASATVTTDNPEQSEVFDSDGDASSTVEAATQGTVKEFTMTAKNWEFSPKTITVKKGDTVHLTITSVDVEHGLMLPDFKVNVKLEPGKSQTVEFVADKIGTFKFRCSVPCGEGHREMEGVLIVQ